MAVEFISDNKVSAWAIWKISESEDELQKLIQPADHIPIEIANAQKRLEYASARALLKYLLAQWNLEYNGLFKDEFGKPFFISHNIALSLTHSFPYVAAIIHKTRSVGIDLEQPKEKLLRIAKRILHPSELTDAGSDLVKHCVYWCAKETLVKVHGKKDVTFSQNLLIEPFQLLKSGNMIGRIVAKGMDETVPLHSRVYDNFVLVVTS